MKGHIEYSRQWKNIGNGQERNCLASLDTINSDLSLWATCNHFYINDRKSKKLAEVFKKYGVEYLIIGKFRAILYGYPGTTQDMDIFPFKDIENGKRLASALRELGFNLNEELEEAIITGKDFIQIRGGPFPIDIVYAPDGIKSFEDAQKRSQLIDGIFFCASIDDIIESKKAAGRQRDKEELPRLELFRNEFKKRENL